MQLKNRFDEEEKMRYWIDHQYCSICGSNYICSLHHINGCVEDYMRSIYNSIMLCHECHKKADTHNTDSPSSLDYRQNLMRYTRARIEYIGKRLNKYDEAFLKIYYPQFRG